MMKRTHTLFGTLAVVGLFIAASSTGCSGGSGSGSTAGTGGNQATVKLPEGLISSEAPPAAMNPADAKYMAVAGQEIAIRGRIGGSKQPFAESRAVFNIVGEGPLDCIDCGDGCKTPWDYCCEPREEISRYSATIQIVDEDGRPLRMNLKGVDGLIELCDLVVVGTVAQADDPVLVVNATRLHFVERR